MPGQTMRGHTSRVRGVVHLPGGRQIVTCSFDGSLRLWDLESGAQIGSDWRDDDGGGGGGGGGEQEQAQEGKEAAVCTIALSPNGDIVASGSHDGTVRLWNIETRKVIAKWTGNTDVFSVCWSADGQRLLSGSDDGTARVWDVKSRETVTEIQTGHGTVWAVLYSPNSSKIATAGGYNEPGVKIWDATTSELLTTLTHDYTVFCLAWTSDGKKLITASYGPIRIFDTATWHQIAILDSGHEYWVWAISLSQNGRILASASDDKTTRLWNLETDLPVGPPLQHEDELQCAAFSADGKLLVTGCKNVYVRDVHAILKEAGLEDLLSFPDVVESTDTDATQAKDNQLPPDFFDGGRDGVQPSALTLGIRSSARRRPLAHSSRNALLGRLLMLFRRSNISQATELQQRPRWSIFSRRDPRDPRDPRDLEVAAVRDKQALYVAPRPVKKTQLKPQGQAQSSSSQSQPAASTFTTPPAPDTNTTIPGAATVQSYPLSLWARLVLFLCCASLPHADGH